MNTLTQLLTAFCAASIFIGALYIICPEGAMSKSVKYILSLAFLLTVVASVRITANSTDFKFDIPIYKAEQSEVLDISCAEQTYAYALRLADINFSKITVCTDKNADGSIVISKVLIYSDCEKERIMQALGEVATNFEVEIINE